MTDLNRESFPQTTTAQVETVPELALENEAPVESPTSSESEPSRKTTSEQTPEAIQPRKAVQRITVTKPVAPRDELTKQVEKIMEEDLSETYRQLSPIAQQEFKMKGEQIARKIRNFMQSNTLKVKKIFKLLLDWLKMLPGINTFFLEQEAKIKTDRLILLHKERALL